MRYITMISLLSFSIVYAQNDVGRGQYVDEIKSDLSTEETASYQKIKAANLLVSATLSNKCSSLAEFDSGEGSVDDTNTCLGKAATYKLGGKPKLSGGGIEFEDHGIDCSGYIAAVLAASGCRFKPGKPGTIDTLETTQMAKDGLSGKSCFVPATGEGIQAGDIVVTGDSGGKEGHTFMISDVRGNGCEGGGSISSNDIRISHSSGKGPKTQPLKEYVNGGAGSAKKRAFFNVLKRACSNNSARLTGVGDTSGAVVLRHDPTAMGGSCKCEKPERINRQDKCSRCDSYRSISEILRDGASL